MRFTRFASALLFVALAAAVAAQGPSGLDPSVPPMRALIERFSADQATLQSVYADPLAPATRERMTAFLRDSRVQLATIDFNALDQESKADLLIFANFLSLQEHQLALDRQQWAEVAPLLPYSAAIFALEDERRQMKRPDPQKAAAQLAELTKAVAATAKSSKAKSRTPPRQSVSPRGAPPPILTSSPFNCSTGSISATATIPPSPGGPRNPTSKPLPRSRSKLAFCARSSPASLRMIRLQSSAHPSAARHSSSSLTTQ